MSDHGVDESLTEDLWASPSATSKQAQSIERPKTPKTPKTPKEQNTLQNDPDSTYDHEAALRKELEGVQSVNRAIEGIIGTLERTKGNMNVRQACDAKFWTTLLSTSLKKEMGANHHRPSPALSQTRLRS